MLVCLRDSIFTCWRVYVLACPHVGVFPLTISDAHRGLFFRGCKTYGTISALQTEMSGLGPASAVWAALVTPAVCGCWPVFLPERRLCSPVPASFIGGVSV